jgi:hypothetical protein
MPTWPGVKIRSPGTAAALLTRWVVARRAPLVRGRDLPAARKAKLTRPEQSKLDGPAEP